MTKQGIVIVSCIIIIVLLTVVFSSPNEELIDTESIAIIAHLPITGSGSDIGIENRDGLKLAIDELNLLGGINGKQIELVIVDNETNLEKAKKIFLETEHDIQFQLFPARIINGEIKFER